MAEDGSTGDESNPKVHNKKDAKRQKILIIVGVVGVAITALLLLRRSSSNAAANTAASTTASGIDPTTGIPYIDEESSLNTGVGAIDPTTGIPYIDEGSGAGSGGGSTTTTTTNNTTTNNYGAGSTTSGGGSSNVPGAGSYGLATLPAAVANAMTAAGEHVVDETGTPNGDTLFLTQMGGVYDVGPGGAGGSDFGGSRFSLTPATQSGIRGTFNKLTLNPNGGYTISDTTGQSYSFK